MDTVVLIVFAFFIGLIAGLLIVTAIQKSNGKSSLKSDDAQILSHMESLNKLSKNILSQLEGISGDIAENSSKISKISKISTFVPPSVSAEDETVRLQKPAEKPLVKTFQRTDVSQSEVQAVQTPERPVETPQETVQPTEKPVETPQETVQTKKPASGNVLEISQLFESVEKLRAVNSEYRVYNSNTNRLECSTDENSKYIVLKRDYGLIILPNQNTPFSRRQVAESVYKCGSDWIDYGYRLTPCIADDSGNILKQGEIF